MRGVNSRGYPKSFVCMVTLVARGARGARGVQIMYGSSTAGQRGGQLAE